MSCSSTLGHNTWVNTSLECNAELLLRVILLLQGLCQGFIGTSLFWIINLKEKWLTKDQCPTDNTEHTLSQISLAFGSLIRSCFAAHRIRGSEWTRARHERWSSHWKSFTLTVWAGNTSLRTKTEWKTLHVNKSGSSIKDSCCMFRTKTTRDQLSKDDMCSLLSTTMRIDPASSYNINYC